MKYPYVNSSRIFLLELSNFKFDNSSKFFLSLLSILFFVKISKMPVWPIVYGAPLFQGLLLK